MAKTQAQKPATPATMPETLTKGFELENAMPVPEGFDAVAALAAIEYDDLADGRVAKYLGTRTIKAKSGKYAGKEYTLYDFEEDADIGYSVWGCAGLDLLMRNIAAGSTVWIRYAGKTAHPTEPSQTLHRFQIAVKGKKQGSTATKAPDGFTPPDDEKLPF